MITADAGVRPFRLNRDAFLALLETGLVPEGRGTELFDGEIVTEMPQGPFHLFVYEALEAVFADAGLLGRRIRGGSTVGLSRFDLVDPEFVWIERPRGSFGLPTPEDVRWAIEVSVSSRAYDLSDKRAKYAEAGIPDYWVFDVTARRLHRFTRPEDGAYTRVAVDGPDGTFEMPGGLGTIDLGAIYAFPADAS